MVNPNILLEIHNECIRQHILWGEQNHENGTDLAYKWKASAQKKENTMWANRGRITWRHILKEEMLEAFAETDPAKLREELVQVAAVAATWIAAIDRRTAPVYNFKPLSKPIRDIYNIEHDMALGPCSCGGWHGPGDMLQTNGK